MTVHAFIDESQRGRFYLVCVVLVDPGDLPAVRVQLRALLMPGQRRLHFVNESARRRLLLAAMSKLPVRARVYPSTKKEPLARRQALAAILSDSGDTDITRIVIERRETGQDTQERRQIAALRLRPGWPTRPARLISGIAPRRWYVQWDVTTPPLRDTPC